MRRLQHRLGLLLAATLIFSSADAAHADPVKCLAGIGKASAAFGQAKMKLLQKCADKLAKGGAPSGSCTDQKTLDKISKAEAKTAAAVVKGCGGKDKTCGTGDDDTLASIG